MNKTENPPAQSEQPSLMGIFLSMLRLGCIAFGGPVAHIAHFREELINKRQWMSDQHYAELMAFCQFLPGPSSSQTGMGLGLARAGIPGMFAAWFGFTLPSVVVLITFALSIHQFGIMNNPAWLHGIKVAVVAVVAIAVWGMAKKLCMTRPTQAIALLGAIFTLLFPQWWAQFILIGMGAFTGIAILNKDTTTQNAPLQLPIQLKHSMLIVTIGGAVCLAAALLPLITNHTYAELLAVMVRTGALVFGGGHVVLPMLESVMVPQLIENRDLFLAGYGATQAVPGPIFTLSSYLGAIIGTSPGESIALGCMACIGIFLPSFVMVPGLLPFWSQLSNWPQARAALAGIAAAVVGLLLATLYDPIVTVAITTKWDVAGALACFLALAVCKVPAWLVIPAAALAASFWP